jgi:hypothetical protein
MASRKDSRRDGARREAERYRQAAVLALRQLAWCVDYLHRIRKRELARQLERNVRTIVERYDL